jgi:hypothetical protein
MASVLTPDRSDLKPNSAALRDQIGVRGNNLRGRPTDCVETSDA